MLIKLPKTCRVRRCYPQVAQVALKLLFRHQVLEHAHWHASPTPRSDMEDFLSLLDSLEISVLRVVTLCEVSCLVMQQQWQEPRGDSAIELRACSLPCPANLEL